MTQAKTPAPAKDETIFDALLGFQSEMPTLPKDKVNPHFHSRFTSLETIVETAGPLLAKHRLAWTALPTRDDQGNPALAYRLTHTSGQAIEGLMPLLLGAGNMQQLGSALTYARRYAMCAVLNLVADEDDDGEAASNGSDLGQTYADAVVDGDTVNLQNDAKGLRNEAINAAFARVGLPAQDKPWGQLGRVPANQADALRDALKLARTAA